MKETLSAAQGLRSTSKLLLRIAILACLVHLGPAAAEDRGDRVRDHNGRGDHHGYRDDDDDDDDGRDRRILAVRHDVPHISTVPAIVGERVKLFVWERVKASKLKKFRKNPPTGKVVLFIHGGTTPSVPAFDLDYKDYSWMESLARAGFDVFSLDRTGYGFSPRPEMDDPCNVNPAQQSFLLPPGSPLAAPCAHSYPFRLTHTNSDSGDIGAAVDYIRALRRVDRITIAGWSGVGPQAGPYAINNQEKVDRLVLYAPSYMPASPTNPPAALPQSGFPMNLRTRSLLEEEWDSMVTCDGQVEPGIRDVVWRRIMDFEPVGRNWGPLKDGVIEGAMRARTTTLWGWNQTTTPKITVPTLIMVGQNDTLLGAARDLYQHLGSQEKVRLEIPCGSHFLNWETNHRFLHKASREWLRKGSLKGVRQGVFTVDRDGDIVPMP
jgi:pimeloyl-ACP methyl ester carboxylesterase